MDCEINQKMIILTIIFCFLCYIIGIVQSYLMIKYKKILNRNVRIYLKNRK